MHPIFTKILNITLTYPNKLDRTLWRLEDYKNQMAQLKKAYAFTGQLKLSRCFIQVYDIFINYFKYNIHLEY